MSRRQGRDATDGRRQGRRRHCSTAAGGAAGDARAAAHCSWAAPCLLQDLVFNDRCNLLLFKAPCEAASSRFRVLRAPFRSRLKFGAQGAGPAPVPAVPVQTHLSASLQQGERRSCGPRAALERQDE